MKIKLHAKSELGELARIHKRHPLVCRFLKADNTLHVYVSPLHLMSAVLALRVDLDGNGTIGDEAARVLLSVIKIMRVPLLK